MKQLLEQDVFEDEAKLGPLLSGRDSSGFYIFLLEVCSVPTSLSFLGRSTAGFNSTSTRGVKRSTWFGMPVKFSIWEISFGGGMLGTAITFSGSGLMFSYFMLGPKNVIDFCLTLHLPFSRRGEAFIR